MNKTIKPKLPAIKNYFLHSIISLFARQPATVPREFVKFQPKLLSTYNTQQTSLNLQRPRVTSCTREWGGGATKDGWRPLACTDTSWTAKLMCRALGIFIRGVRFRNIWLMRKNSIVWILFIVETPFVFSYY